jgi:hypothetical protein
MPGDLRNKETEINRNIQISQITTFGRPLTQEKLETSNAIDQEENLKKYENMTPVETVVAMEPEMAQWKKEMAKIYGEDFLNFMTYGIDEMNISKYEEEKIKEEKIREEKIREEKIKEEKIKETIFRMKIFYCFFILFFSVIFLCLSGIDLNMKNFGNLRVTGEILALAVGIFLIHINLFVENYALEDRLLSSVLYLILLCMMAYFYKPLLYDPSSYEPPLTYRGSAIIAIISQPIYLIAALTFYMLIKDFNL